MPFEQGQFDPESGLPVQARTPPERSPPGLARLEPTVGVGARLGDFTLLLEIGRGAQGVVFEARQESLDRHVALKVLPPHLTLSERHIERFHREAAAGAQLEHRGIVAVHAFGRDRGHHFIAQELVPGGRSLLDSIAEMRHRHELPHGYYRRVAARFAEIAEALQAAHDVGVIHRDIKPANILLAPDGQPKVADFGLAKMEDSMALSRTGELTGTPFYMSPEQAVARRIGIDHRTDIFSLGSTMYEALTLTRPFNGDTRQQIIERIMLLDPPDPYRLRARLPRDLAVICMKALEKRRSQRYPTAGDMAADLRRFLANEPIRARPPGPLARLVKWRRRHPVLATAGMVGTFALAVVSVLVVQLFAVQADQAEAERLRMQAEADVLRAALEAKLVQRMHAEAETEAAESYQIVADNLVNAMRDATAQGLTLDARAAMTSIGELVKTYDDPLDRQRLGLAAGKMARGMGLTDEALSHLSASLNLSRDLFGSLDLRTASIARETALMHKDHGEWKQAEALLLEAFDIHWEVSGEEDPLIASDLGTVYSAMRQPDKAERWYRKTYDLLEEQGGDPRDPRAVLTTLQNLFQHALDVGDDEAAERWAVEARERARSELPVDDPYTLRSARNLARLRHLQGNALLGESRPDEAEVRLAEAELLFREALEAQRRVLPRGHEDLLDTLGDSGLLLADRGRLDEAIGFLTEAYETARTTRGERDRLALWHRNSLASVVYRAGRRDEAERTWREIVAWGDGWSSEDQGVLYALQNLSMAQVNRATPDSLAEAARMATTLVELTDPHHARYDLRVLIRDTARERLNSLRTP